MEQKVLLILVESFSNMVSSRHLRIKQNGIYTKLGLDGREIHRSMVGCTTTLTKPEQGLRM